MNSLCPQTLLKVFVRLNQQFVRLNQPFAYRISNYSPYALIFTFGKQSIMIYSIKSFG